MEHRYSTRAVTYTNLLIYKCGIPVAFGRVVNSSKIGLFIETNFSEINIDQSLNIEWMPARNEEHVIGSICTVRVIRKTALGLGVEIEFSSVELINVLSPNVDVCWSTQFNLNLVNL